MFMTITISALVVILVITLRWFSHRERMALIAQGLPLENLEQDQEGRYKLLLSIGLIVGLVGLALTIGLFTLGRGVWLLAGLIPLFAGLALVLTGLILRPEKPKSPPEPEEVESMEDDAVPEFAPEHLKMDEESDDEEEDDETEEMALA